jgi:hypothetical protein
MDVKLKTKHIIMLSKLVTKLDLHINLEEKDPLKAGYAIVYELVTHAQLADAEFYGLVGSLMNTTPEIAAETEIEQIIDVLDEVVTKVINFIKRRKGSVT